MDYSCSFSLQSKLSYQHVSLQNLFQLNNRYRFSSRKAAPKSEHHWVLHTSVPFRTAPPTALSPSTCPAPATLGPGLPPTSALGTAPVWPRRAACLQPRPPHLHSTRGLPHHTCGHQGWRQQAPALPYRPATQGGPLLLKQQGNRAHIPLPSTQQLQWKPSIMTF